MTKALEVFKHHYLIANISSVVSAKYGDSSRCDYYDARCDAINDCAEDILSKKECEQFFDFRVRVATDKY